MKYILVAIVDSENSSLPERVDEKRRAYLEALTRFDTENKNRSIEEIGDAFQNQPEEVSVYSRLVGLFEGKLRLPLKKYQETEFEMRCYQPENSSQDTRVEIGNSFHKQCYCRIHHWQKKTGVQIAKKMRS